MPPSTRSVPDAAAHCHRGQLESPQRRWMRGSTVIPKVLPDSGATPRHNNWLWETLGAQNAATEHLEENNHKEGRDCHKQHISLRLKGFHESWRTDVTG